MGPYRKVGIASTFSPTHLAVLAEAFHLVQRLGCTAEILHAAPETPDVESRFRQSLATLHREADRVYLPGTDPCAALLAAVTERQIDLLIAGALEHLPTSEDRSYTGTVARRLLAEAPCDVLLLPRPQQNPPLLDSAFFAVHPSQELSDFIRHTTRLLGLRHVILGVAETPFAAALALSRGTEPINLENWAHQLADAANLPDVDFETRIVDSNTGFGLCDAARASGAQLLIACAPRRNGHTELPDHLNWMRQVIPTRLLLCAPPTA